MSVLRRSMFRRPSALPPLRGPMPVVRETYPVVKRDSGSPKEGEMTVEDYIAKGYDPYEFEADQSMDSSPKEKPATTFFEKWFDAGSGLGPGVGPYGDPEQPNILDLREYGVGVYDITDPQFIKFIETRYMNEGDSFQDGIDNYIEFLKEGVSQRAEGSPISGENSYYSHTINPEIIKEQDIALDKQTRSHEQWLRENDAGVNRIITTNIMNVAEGNVNQPTVILDAVANSFKRFGKDETLKMLIGSNFHQTNPKIFQYIFSLDENFPRNFQYEQEIEGREGLYEYLGPSDDYSHRTMPENMKRYIDPLMEIMSTDIVSRQQGSPMQGEQVNVENVGIMDGFNQDPEQVAEQVLMEGMGAREKIDGADTYDELMRAIRGDNLSESDRRQELASIVGEKDAETTPDSVLVLVQPVMQMLNQESANTGIAEIESGALQMPQQPVGIATGGVVQKFNQGNLATRFENILPTYLGLADRFSDPNQGQADALMALSRAGFKYGQGEGLPDAARTFFDETYALGKQKAASDEKMKMQLAMAALSQAGQQELAAMKLQNEATKKKQTLAVGQTPERDKFIAIKLGFVKDAPTGVKGNPMGDQGPEYSEVVDWERFYDFYPRGTELQFNWDFTEFLGKKGSAIRYEGKGEDYKDGGIVKRASGTNEIGEIADTDQIFEYEGVGTSTETDDINKLIARSNNTLKELYRMKEILVNNPEIGGAPGWALETFQGLFTMIDQLDDAYLGDRFFDKKGKAYKMFNQKEIQEIQMLKNSIAQGIADLRSFKGTRQPTATQEAVSVKEIDPTGWFGGDVAKQKVDAVTEKVANLLKEYIKLTTKGDDDTMNKQAVADKFANIDSYVASILNLQPQGGSTGFKQKKSYTLDDLEEIIKLGDGDASAVELSDTTIEEN